MNVSQFAPPSGIVQEVLGPSGCPPAAGEVLAAGQSRRGHGGARLVVEQRAQLATASATYEYGVTPEGRCVLVRCASDARELVVPDLLDGRELAIVGPHAFSTCYNLERVVLPASVERICEHAFMNTALRAFEAPAALTHIGAKAFYKCAQLQSIALPAGLVEIGRSAFRESALRALSVPASVERIGHDAFRSTELEFAGVAPTLSIDPGNRRYRLVGGVLYALEERGLVLVQVLSWQEGAFDAPPGIVAVASRAFAGIAGLSRIAFHEGVASIGDAAFRGCGELEEVGLPDSLASIGDRAFWETSLRVLRIPARLREVGQAAFYTGATVARSFRPTLREIQVAPGNTAFFEQGGMLCRRLVDGGAEVIAYAGRAPELVIPRCVTDIGQYAFLNHEEVRLVQLHDQVRSIGAGGLDFGRAVPTVAFERTSGRGPERIVVAFPPGEAGRQALHMALGSGNVDVELASIARDNAILATRDTYVRARMMLERLADPVMLEPRVKELFRKRVRTAMPDVVAVFGRNGYLRGIDYLYEQGFLDAGNIDAAVEAAVGAQELAVTAKLVALRRSLVDEPLFDFDL